MYQSMLLGDIAEHRYRRLLEDAEADGPVRQLALAGWPGASARR